MKQLSQFDLHHVLADTRGISLVMFGSQDCGSCRHLKQLLTTLSRAPDNTVSFFEVDAQRDIALAREFEVFHLPAMFLFRDGVFHCELHSPAQPAALLKSIQRALAQPAEEAP